MACRGSKFIVSFLFAVLLLTPCAAQQSDLNAILKRSRELHAVGSYSAALAEAEILEKEVKRRFGENHANYAVALNNLAIVYKAQGKYADAEGLYRRALAIREKVLGSSHADVAGTLSNLANVYSAQGKYADAEGLYRRALAIYEKALGASHPDVAGTLNNLALVYQAQGKYANAEGLYKRALAVYEKALGADHPDVAQTLNNLAVVHGSLGKYAQAEGLYRRALAIREKALGVSHPDIAPTLIGLANIYRAQGKYADAEGLYKRALAIDEKVFGPTHPGVASSLIGLANVYRAQGRSTDAEKLYKRALAINEQPLGPNHPVVAGTLNSLANVYQAQGKYADAEGLLKRALAIREQALGSSHPDLASTLNDLAVVYEAQGKYANAEGLYKRALAINEQALGANHPVIAQFLNNLAFLAGMRRDVVGALAYSRRATATIITHASADVATTSNTEKGRGLIEQRAEYFHLHVANLAGAVRARLEPEAALGREALEIGQWALHSSAAAAVQQMAVRFAPGGDALAGLVREQQDLAAAWRERDKALIAALSKPEGRQDKSTTDSIRKQIGEIESRLAAVRARLEKEFPDYAALASPKPLKVEDIQKLLGNDEAVVFWLAGDNAVEILAVSRGDFAWKRWTGVSKQQLEEKVRAFRRGLDVNELNRAIEIKEKPALFDLALAHELYAALLGPVESLIKDKRHLLVVPSDSLTALPFHLLLTEKPAADKPEVKDIAAYRDAAWLLKRHAITVLPSVASLKALRVFARQGQGTKPIIGFGDPVFKEEPAQPSATQRIVLKKTAAKTRAYGDYWRGAEVDRQRLAEADPLPDTADELKTVAAKLGAPQSDIYLGKAASETTVKQAPLSNYRIVYFATHGLVAGDVKGNYIDDSL